MASLKMILYDLTMLVSGAASALPTRQEVPLTSTCPANYKADIMTTNATSGHIFTIFSPSNPETHNHALQLCPILLPDPALPGGIVKHTTYGASTIGCLSPNTTHPVLLSQLRSGGLYSQLTTPSSPGQPFTISDAGPTAYLSRFDSRGSTTRFNFTFTPSAITDSLVEKEWQLTQIDWEGQYGLYHLTENGVVHGFALCDMDGDGEERTWKQMFYTRAQGFEMDEGDYPECEQVGLRTTVAPLIKDGECKLASVVDDLEE